eukprot:5946052-Alexandrium_andersonii.AAC.1
MQHRFRRSELEPRGPRNDCAGPEATARSWKRPRHRSRRLTKGALCAASCADSESANEYAD